MPDVILNCAGLTRTTGTANPVITAETGKNRDPRDVLVNGQQVAYRRTYASSKAGYENAIGNWVSATGTITRTSIEASSNSNNPVVWGVGLQLIEITVTAAMLAKGATAETYAAGNDARFDADDLDGMTVATELDGTEKSAFSQGGDPVSVTSQLLSPSAIIQAQGYRRQFQQSFTNFTHAPPSFSGTNGAMFGIEPVVCHLGNGGTVTHPAALSWPFRRGIAQCSISTNTASYAGITSTNYPFTPDPVLTEFYFGACLGLTAVPAGPSGQQRFVIGIFDSVANAEPTTGIYFMGGTFGSYWRMYTKSSITEDFEDSSVAFSAVNLFSLPDAWTTFEIMALQGNDNPVQFYINSTLVAEIEKGSAFPTGAPLFAGAYCAQRGYNVASSLVVDAMHCKLDSTDDEDTVYGMGTGLL